VYVIIRVQEEEEEEGERKRKATMLSSFSGQASGIFTRMFDATSCVVDWHNVSSFT
jgi:hypothetical protein